MKYDQVLIVYRFFIRDSFFIEFYANIDHRGVNAIIFDNLEKGKTYIDITSDLLDMNKTITYKKIVKSDKFDNATISGFINIVQGYSNLYGCKKNLYSPDENGDTLYSKINRIARKYNLI